MFSKRQFENIYDEAKDYFDNHNNECIKTDKWGRTNLFDYEYNDGSSYFHAVRIIDCDTVKAVEVEIGDIIYNLVFDYDNQDFNRCYKYSHDNDGETDIEFRTFRKHYTEWFKKLKDRAFYRELSSIFDRRS